MSKTYWRQAIVTKYHGPTNTRAARVSARCDAATIFLTWDNKFDVDDNHTIAARTLAHKLGWPHSKMVGGGLPSGGYAFVFPE